jgi:hypothetical protein
MKKINTEVVNGMNGSNFWLRLHCCPELVEGLSFRCTVYPDTEQSEVEGHFSGFYLLARVFVFGNSVRLISCWSDDQQ